MGEMATDIWYRRNLLVKINEELGGQGKGERSAFHDYECENI